MALQLLICFDRTRPVLRVRIPSGVAEGSYKACMSMGGAGQLLRGNLTLLGKRGWLGPWQRYSKLFARGLDITGSTNSHPTQPKSSFLQTFACLNAMGSRYHSDEVSAITEWSICWKSGLGPCPDRKTALPQFDA